MSVFAEVVDPRNSGRKDVIWIKRDHVLQESSELVHFRFHLDVGSGILLEEVGVVGDFGLNKVDFLFEDLENLFFAEDIDEVAGSVVFFDLGDGGSDFGLKLVEVAEGVVGEVLRWRFVGLH
jgi:hypothetical protein